MIIQNPFLVTNKFSEEAKQIFTLANVASQQMELIEPQENVALKEQVGNCDPAAFWGKMVPAADFPVLNKMAPHPDHVWFHILLRVNILHNEHLHHCLRIVLTQLFPKFKVLAEEQLSFFSLVTDVKYRVTSACMEKGLRSQIFLCSP